MRVPAGAGSIGTGIVSSGHFLSVRERDGLQGQKQESARAQVVAIETVCPGDRMQARACVVMRHKTT